MRGRLAGVATLAVLAAACATHPRSHPRALAPSFPPYSAGTASSAPASTGSSPSATVSASGTAPAASRGSTPASTGPGRCHTAQLQVAAVMGQAGLGHVGQLLVFTNRSHVTCTLLGYPGLLRLTASSTPMPTQVVRGQGYLYRDPGPHLVTLRPGATASSGIEWDHIPGPGDPQTGCPASTYLEVTAPNAFSHLVVRDAVDACSGGRIDVTAVQAGSAGPGT